MKIIEFLLLSFCFVFSEDIEVIKAKERESPKQAAGLLLDQLKASSEVGKWTTFLNALNFTGMLIEHLYESFLLRQHDYVDSTLAQHSHALWEGRWLICLGQNTMSILDKHYFAHQPNGQMCWLSAEVQNWLIVRPLTQKRSTAIRLPVLSNDPILYKNGVDHEFCRKHYR